MVVIPTTFDQGEGDNIQHNYCNNPDFSTFFFAIYWKISGNFFFTGSTKISAESPLYW